MPMTLAEVRAFLGGASIRCPLCGDKLQSLATHLGRVHGVKVRAFKIEHGIPLSWPLETHTATEARKAGKTPEQREAASRLKDFRSGARGQAPVYAPATREFRSEQQKRRRESRMAEIAWRKRNDVQGT